MNKDEYYKRAETTLSVPLLSTNQHSTTTNSVICDEGQMERLNRTLLQVLRTTATDHVQNNLFAVVVVL